MRRPFLAIIFAALLAIALVVPGVAFANFGPHGGYEQDTDSCAGCHRAHTSFSSIKLSGAAPPSRYALLAGSGNAVYEFCYACHDNTSQGAETNVDAGVYEGTKYGDSGGDLNGGPFDISSTMGITSRHMSVRYDGIDEGGPGGAPASVMATWAIGAYGGGAYGAGTAGADGGTGSPTIRQDDCDKCHIKVTSPLHWIGTRSTIVGMSDPIQMSCTACHDPHGSSNYRLLKDVVNGNLVGDAPGGALTPYVTSIETGYPQMGWLLRDDGASQMATYEPNYTTELYARAPSSESGISGWCAGCHSTYIKDTWLYNEGDGGYGGTGKVTRHRHPVNVALSEFDGLGPDPLVLAGNPLPLGHDAATEDPSTVTNESEDELNCMSCHKAHSSDATMSGYAEVDPDGNYFLQHASSVLLRLPNYGVCQACHNK